MTSLKQFSGEKLPRVAKYILHTYIFLKIEAFEPPVPVISETTCIWAGFLFLFSFPCISTCMIITPFARMTICRQCRGSNRGKISQIKIRKTQISCTSSEPAWSIVWHEAMSVGLNVLISEETKGMVCHQNALQY